MSEPVGEADHDGLLVEAVLVWAVDGKEERADGTKRGRCEARQRSVMAQDPPLRRRTDLALGSLPNALILSNKQWQRYL